MKLILLAFCLFTISQVIPMRFGNCEEPDFGVATGFLSKSQILSSTGVQILPIQISKAGFVLPILGSGSDIPKVLLATDGQSYPLELAKSEKKVKLDVRTCGADEIAFPWKTKAPIRASGLFIATGKDMAGVKIRWIPAVDSSLSGTSDCLKAKSDLTQVELSVREIPGISEKVFFVNYKTPEELKWEQTYKKYGEKAYSMSPPNCKVDSGYQKVGMVGAKCTVLLESAINCEGQGYDEGQFGKPLGLLDISKGATHEKWLVFLASGYEGDAYLGIRMTPEHPAKEADIDFYVYSGC